MKHEKIISIMLNTMPDILHPLRRKLLLSLLKSHGSNIRGMWQALIDGYESIVIGNNFFAAEGLYLSSTKGILIGNNVTFGPEVMLIGGNHKTDIPGLLINQIHSGDKLDEIIIQDDVWVGARAIILSGVTVGEGSIIGAGSIVTKNIPYYYICAGNPCKPIKPRFNNKADLSMHLDKVKAGLSLDHILQQYNELGLSIKDSNFDNYSNIPYSQSQAYHIQIDSICFF